jgi:hypothetical protein
MSEQLKISMSAETIRDTINSCYKQLKSAIQKKRQQFEGTDIEKIREKLAQKF